VSSRLLSIRLNDEAEDKNNKRGIGVDDLLEDRQQREEEDMG